MVPRTRANAEPTLNQTLTRGSNLRSETKTQWGVVCNHPDFDVYFLFPSVFRDSFNLMLVYVHVSATTDVQLISTDGWKFLAKGFVEESRSINEVLA
jgi:hypothetical protein